MNWTVENVGSKGITSPEYYAGVGKSKFRIRTTMMGKLFIATRILSENQTYSYLDSPRFSSLEDAKRWCARIGSSN